MFGDVKYRWLATIKNDDVCVRHFFVESCKASVNLTITLHYGIFVQRY